MNASVFYTTLIKDFPFIPTQNQEVFFQKITTFLFDENNNEVFVLKGFAGTGKTTLVSTIVNNLVHINKKYVLLAPTGRAAKVIANYSKKPAYTIHKKIYFPNKVSGGGLKFTKQQNKHKNTLFFVDEASMISDVYTDSKNFESTSLLDDLITYVYSGTNCKMILIGDDAQLPPVNLEVSPALNTDTLQIQYDVNVKYIELEEVVRQELESGILYNATQLRQLLKNQTFDNFQFQLKGFKDIVWLQDGFDIQDAIESAYSN
jgi:ATP-dependent exoDNAse (exonuclease V) alpha subunit